MDDIMQTYIDRMNKKKKGNANESHLIEKSEGI